MRKLIKSIVLLTASLALGLTGCVSEGNENGGKSKEGKKTTIQLRVLTSGATTRAAGDDERDTEGTEAVLDDAVHVFVFKDSGELEHYSLETLADNKTGAIDITTGDKYFYVISDPIDGFEWKSNPQDAIDFVTVECENNRSIFEQMELYPLNDEGGNLRYVVADPVNNPEHGFVNMTLWGVKQTITAATETVDAEIGRLVAKVSLNEKPSGFTSKMEGTWDDFKFTLGAIAYSNFLVGQYEGTVAPPATGHGRVTSYAHNLPYDHVYNGSKYYKNYSADSFKEPYTADNESYLYVTENTSAKMKSDGTVSTDGSLYYGNTTYVLFAATYTPADTEWHSHLDASQAGATYKHIDGKSFYTAKVDGQTLVFGQSPVSTMEGLDENSIRFYENGVNYYHFPIRDRKETALEDQCRVLRNHWYDITVNSIDRFGDTDTTVTPSEPVDEEIELDVLIKVLKWASVSQSENL